MRPRADRFLPLLLVALILGTVSCSRKIYVPVESVVYHNDSTARIIERRDSVFFRDSVFTLIRGDTVYIYQQHDRFHDRVLVDTIYLSKTDTITSIVKVPPDPPAKSKERGFLDGLELVLSMLGASMLGFAIATVVNYVKKHQRS